MLIDVAQGGWPPLLSYGCICAPSLSWTTAVLLVAWQFGARERVEAGVLPYQVAQLQDHASRIAADPADAQ